MQHTWNIFFMVVTLDVSRLSGWLNGVYCQEQWGLHRGRGVGGEVGGCEATFGASNVCRLEVGGKARATRTANM